MCFMPDYLNAVTALYPIKLMKTVRLRVSDTEQLLLDPELNLKVVVLVRDPRGVYASRYVTPPFLLLDPELNLKVVVLVRDPRGVYASRYVTPPPSFS